MIMISERCGLVLFVLKMQLVTFATHDIQSLELMHCGPSIAWPGSADVRAYGIGICHHLCMPKQIKRLLSLLHPLICFFMSEYGGWYECGT